MSEVKCGCLSVVARRLSLDFNTGVEIICSSCREVIWRDKKISINHFNERRSDLMRLFGYDRMGNKVTKGKIRTRRVRLPNSEDQTDVVLSDKELLLWRIDMALDNRDEVAFDLLVQELEGVE